MMPAAATGQPELPFSDPLEPRILPRAGWPFWTLNTLRPEGGGMRQRVYRLHQMEWVLARIRKDRDTYLSQGFFAAPCRRALHLAWCTHAYVDLDTYKAPRLAGLTPEQVAGRLVLFCRDEGLPLPTVVIFSGRGIYAKWCWSAPIPRAAGRAVAVNKALVRIFAEFGADPIAVDVSRLLRVVGTLNTKSGDTARILWLNQANGAPVTYDFDSFADEVLPYTLEQIRGFRADAARRRAEVHVLSHERALREGRRAAEAHRSGGGGRRAFVPEDWHWGVVEDLRCLAWRRHGGQVPYADQQGPEAAKVGPDLFGFHGACQLARVIPAPQLWHEIRAWARLILPPDYLDGEAFARHCSTLLDRAKRAAAGESVDYKGRRVSPIYAFRKQTIIEQLRITPEEERRMTRLISDAEKRRRDREAWRAAHTGRTREEWLVENGASRAKPWEAEGISRATWYHRRQAEQEQLEQTKKAAVKV